ncbi:MAG: hypothetical protein P8080_00045 [Gammaproteobacteria bacterium]
MHERDLEAAVLRALDTAGDLGGRPVDPDRPLVDQLELDPDRFAAALARETGVEVPPGHRGRLATLSGCLDYFSRRLSG